MDILKPMYHVDTSPQSFLLEVARLLNLMLVNKALYAQQKDEAKTLLDEGLNKAAETISTSINTLISSEFIESTCDEGIINVLNQFDPKQTLEIQKQALLQIEGLHCVQ